MGKNYKLILLLAHCLLYSLHTATVAGKASLKALKACNILEAKLLCVFINENLWNVFSFLFLLENYGKMFSRKCGRFSLVFHRLTGGKREVLLVKTVLKINLSWGLHGGLNKTEHPLCFMKTCSARASFVISVKTVLLNKTHVFE